MRRLDYTLHTGEPITIFDRTDETAGVTRTTDQRHIYAGGGRARTRDPSGINQIVLHHTGFTARNDHRFDTVMAHYAVRHNGDILQLRPHGARLQASPHTRRAIDIEFEGNHISGREFRNFLNHLVRRVEGSEWVNEFEDHLRTDIDDSLIMRFIAAHAAAGCRGTSRLPSVLVPTIPQLAAGRQLVSFLTETVSSIEHIYSHQQVYAHGNRGNCPGPHIWYNVGKWAVDHLGLTSSGALRPIPPTIGRGQIGWEDNRFQLL